MLTKFHWFQNNSRVQTWADRGDNLRQIADGIQTSEEPNKLIEIHLVLQVHQILIFPWLETLLFADCFRTIYDRIDTGAFSERKIDPRDFRNVISQIRRCYCSSE